MMMGTFYLPLTRRVTSIAVLLAGMLLWAGPVSAQDHASKKDKAASKSIGFTLSADAKEKDLGLPIYPGAKEYKEDANSDAGLQMALSRRFFLFGHEIRSEFPLLRSEVFSPVMLAVNCWRPRLSAESPIVSDAGRFCW